MSTPQPVRRVAATGPSTTAIFLVLRRMRAPLIVLISLFSISIVGLTLVPGEDIDGKPWHMDLFHAFYFLSYTATSIGFGETPYPFSTQQRAWVTVTIYLGVFAWAYAIGSLLSLMRDEGYREAMRLQRFDRRVRHLREPFLILAGFGQAGEVVARSLDQAEHRLVVLDVEPTRVEALDLAAFHSDVPGLHADASNPHELRRAGLLSRHCRGVIALTNDDEANLAVTMTASLLRPDLPVLCRTLEDVRTERIRALGSPMIIDPFNLFGDSLLLAVRAPQTHRLATWLTANQGDRLPKGTEVPATGRWIVCGYGRFGRHLVSDLQRHEVPVTAIDWNPAALAGGPIDGVQGDATDPQVQAGVDPGSAVAFAAATDSDTTNLSLIVAAKQLNPDLFTVARQNDPANGPLFDALDIDAVLVPTRLVAHEVLARIRDPLLWRFYQEAQQRDDSWGGPLLERLTAVCGSGRPAMWTMRLSSGSTPALASRLRDGGLTVGALLRDPEDRERVLDVVPLLIQRDGAALVAPDADELLLDGDRLLLAGRSRERRAIDTIGSVPSAAEYVLTGRRVGQSWIWRTLVDR
ncbi:MAG TPA: NAD-binding protein [Actinomycetota bacterium]|nr:NAD-binding protein [Actinomycetota bacterium]